MPVAFLSNQNQTAGEELIWKLDVKNIASAPASPSINKIVDLSTGTDVKASVMPVGTPSVSGTIISLPILKLLTAGRTYRVHVLFTDGGSNKHEAVFFVYCQF